MPDIERVQARLSNIESVAPILGALRTISLGSWQLALRRREDVQRYGRRLLTLLPPILAQMPRPKRSRYRKRKSPPEAPSPATTVVLMIGSERGLCGRYNTVLANFTAQYVRQLQERGLTVNVHSLGKRGSRILTQQNIALTQSYALPATTLPPFTLAEELTKRHLSHREQPVDIIYSQYHNAVQSRPQVYHWLPPQLPPIEAAKSAEVIIETEPRELYERILAQWAAVTLYGLLLEAAASEHAARFRLMESASQNAERLTEELMQELQSARRQAITREMQELAVGAGLLE